MYQTTELKKGLKIELESKVYLIVKADFTNPGKGSAFVKCRLKNLESGTVVERTFKSGVSTGATSPNLEERKMEYLYNDGSNWFFMDQENFETIEIHKDYVDEATNYLVEGIHVGVLFYNGKPISIEFPNFVNLTVQETDPGLKGDSAAGGMKKAMMETGLQVSVPLFIKEGEKLKIDSRTGEYVERVKE